MDQNMPLKRQSSRRRSVLRDRQFVTSVPYLWLILFFLIPFLLVFKISLSESVLAVPPYLPIFEWAHDGFLNIHLNIGNYLRLFLDPFYASGLMTSLIIAFAATLVCLVVGYTIAYSIIRVPQHWRFIFLLLIILPFWTSFLVRVYGWMGILSKDGLLNQLLLFLGFIQEPKQFLYNNFSVIVGIVYCYLPFMILPIYSVLEKIDEVYLEAAYDLGCSPWKAFWRVTFPLSLPGVLSGVALVFIPALGEFVIPELLGAPDNLMIGRIIWIEFFNNRDWPIASTVAVVMLLMFIVPIMILQRRQLRKQG
ncbi:MAG: ABC transporter permease subunit [Candidatus Paracaedibacteraceae bacterium]|nr:ABC transporter permease subunit [Candidatus Paracaedibacteraceae bacterium]